jgi:hypothetical protein
MSTCSNCKAPAELRGNHLFVRISNKLVGCLSSAICTNQCQCHVPIYCLSCVKAHRLKNKRLKKSNLSEINQQRIKEEREKLVLLSLQNKELAKQANIERHLQAEEIARQRKIQDDNACMLRRQPFVDSVIQSLHQLSSNKRLITDIKSRICHCRSGDYDTVDIYFTLSSSRYLMTFTMAQKYPWTIVIKPESGYRSNHNILNTTYAFDYLKTKEQIQTYISHCFAIMPI